MLDADHVPWVLEVNARPALSGKEGEMKQRLLQAILELTTVVTTTNDTAAAAAAATAPATATAPGLRSALATTTTTSPAAAAAGGETAKGGCVVDASSLVRLQCFSGSGE
jgi:hypothetical protein